MDDEEVEVGVAPPTPGGGGGGCLIGRVGAGGGGGEESRRLTTERLLGSGGKPWRPATPLADRRLLLKSVNGGRGR